MGVKFREKSSGDNKISTSKPYRTKPFGGETAAFSRTSVLRSEIIPKLRRKKSSGPTPVEVSEVDQRYRDADDARLEIF